MDIKQLYEIYKTNPVISTDSRHIQEGSIFFAISGSTYDGNQFAADAIEKGATYAVVTDASLKGEKYIIVDNTLETLQSLAIYHRQHFTIPVIAITGTNGKTTTKELVTTVLKSKFKVHATRGNYNNHIGVPLTLLSMPSDTEIAVIEMGANHIGEIKMLCSYALPTHGLITNIGKAHLEGFGSVEGVRQAKGELFEFLKETGGYAFVNADDPAVHDLSENMIDKTTYGFKQDYHPAIYFNYQGDSMDGGFTISDPDNLVTIKSSMFGHYNAMNMLAAYTVGLHFNVERDVIIQQLTSFVPGANRSERIIRSGCTVIKDAYNANPSSMELALHSFAENYPNGCVVLGAMKELGIETDHAHSSIVNRAIDLGFKKIFLVGNEFLSAMPETNSGSDLTISNFNSIEELKEKWDWNDFNCSAILLKGSRSMHLEKLLD